MAKVTAIHPQKSKPIFNPQANYQWDPNDVFEITGLQLAALYHCLIREVNDPQGASVALKYEAYSVIMELFKRGVEQGALVEMENSPVVEQIGELEDQVHQLFHNKDNSND